MRSLIVLLIGGMLATGCAPDSAAPPAISSRHPASPDAPEAPLPTAPEALALDHSSVIDAPPAHSSDHADMHHHDHSAEPTPIPPGESMEGHAGHLHATTSATTQATYVCPMHPQVTASKAGNCPICGMALRAKGDK